MFRDKIELKDLNIERCGTNSGRAGSSGTFHLCKHSSF
jgi:hypothetical protein